MSVFEHRHWEICLVILGLLGFSAIVAMLHFVQPRFDARYQLMSELALGPHGWAMLPAFCLLAISVLGVQLELRHCVPSIFLQLLHSGIVLSLIGAGVFPLGSSTDLHVALVIIVFILLGIAMYILPSYSTAFRAHRIRATSWFLVGTMAAIGALGCTLIPLGIAQRLAASCVLVWLALAGWVLSRKGATTNAVSSFADRASSTP